jgi:hypothetical protein
VLTDCFSGHSNIGKMDISRRKFFPLKLDGYKPFRQTWAASAEKMREVIKQLKYEKDHPEITPFRFLGENSILSRQIEHYDTTHNELLKIREKDPEKFQDICLVYEAWKIQHTKYSRSSLRECLNNRMPTSKLLYFFYKRVFYTSADWEEFVINDHVSSSYTTFFYLKLFLFDMPISVALTPIEIMDENILKAEVRRHEEKVVEFGSLLMELDQCVKKITISSHNCFTKARSILRMIDSSIAEEIGEKEYERFGILPTLYLPEQKSL